MKIDFDKIIERLKEITNENRDLIAKNNRSVVACALIAKSGEIYEGLNVSWWHSSCAEVVALGNALMKGERKFEYVISVKLNKRNNRFELVSPCGICREMFSEFGQKKLKFVLKDKNGEYIFPTIGESRPY